MSITKADHGTYTMKTTDPIIISASTTMDDDGRIQGTEYTIDDLKSGVNAGTWTFTPEAAVVDENMNEIGSMGGRRRRKGLKGGKKSRKGNKMLSSWVAFVKKVQHEEKISYSDAMKRASARKKEWKRGQMGGAESMSDDSTGSGSGSDSGSGSGSGSGTGYTVPDDDMDGGRRRRGTKRRGSRKRRGTRKRR